MRRLTLWLFLAFLGTAGLVACGNDDSEDPSTGDPPETTDQDTEGDPGSDPELSVEPGCVEIGDSFTVVASGLEPGERYELLIDPRPDPLERGAFVDADDEGEAELPGSTPDAVEDTGAFTWQLLETDDDAVLATATFEIAETCAAEEGAWSELPDAPIANRLNHSATWGGGLVMIWGGQDQDTREISADGAAWDPGTGEWLQISSAPIEPRWAHDAVWTGDELIVWGGGEGPDHLADCYTDGGRYDPAARTWQPIPPAPGPTRCAASVVWADDELLVFGGHLGGGPPGPDSRHADGVAYDPASDQWRSIPAAPIAPRAATVAGWIDGELIVYGGHTQAGDGEGFEYLTDGAAYDPDADQWREIPDSPLPPLNGIEAVVAEGRLMVLGGTDPTIGADEHSTAVAAYDPAEDRWESLADLPAARPSWDGVHADGVVYLIGSRLQPSGPQEDTSDEGPAFLAYVIDSDRWLERPSPPGGGRSNHALAWTGAELIAWGGQTTDDDRTAIGLRWDPPA